MNQFLLYAGLFVVGACKSSISENQKNASALSATSLTKSDSEFFQNAQVNAYESFTSGNRTPYIERFSPDAIYMAPNMETLKGKEAIKKFILSYPSVRVEFPIVEILGTSSHANVRGTYAVSDTAGKFLDKGKYLSIWQKDSAGNWMLTHEIYNSDVPVPSEKK